MSRSRSWAIAIAGIALLATAAGASEKVKQDLTSTGIVGSARGRAKVVVKSPSDGRFQVKGQKLAPDTSYDLIVGGVKVATLRTSGGGTGKVRFRSRPGSNDLPLGFDPRGAVIEVRDASGENVLETQMGSSSGLDPGEVICCIPDDSGPDCEDRTPADCALAGGTETSATSCLSDPCGSNPPVSADIVCCIPDNSGPECEDRTQAECAAAGGVVVQATSCLPNNPCQGTPQSPDIRCCLPDDSGPKCEDRTAAECVAQGGVDLGAGSCTPNPCP